MSDQNADMVDIVGVIPMAGLAKRLSDLKCSKEIYPVWFERSTRDSSEPRAVCECLLGAMRSASVRKAYIILREGKWDIPAYLGSGNAISMDLAYLMMQLPYGTAYSTDQAYPFVKSSRVAFGFPDMIFSQNDAFIRLRKRQQAMNADVTLGVFPADRPEKVDMVSLAEDGRVEQIEIKPSETDLTETWGIALWTPRFSSFMHEFLLAYQEMAAEGPELYVGDVVRAAMENGLSVYGARVSDQPFIDIGTWEDLRRADRGA
jgi:glucose-1-phosphate thymidylyltransferase